MNDISFQSLIPGVRLAKGAHKLAGPRMCAMEMVAWLEGLPHSDNPACTCPVLAAYVRSVNDRMPDAERDRLLPFLPRLVGTVSKPHRAARLNVLRLALITKALPPLYRLLKLPSHADAMAGAQTVDEGRKAALAASKAARTYAARADADYAYAAYADAAYAAAAAANAEAAAAAYADAILTGEKLDFWGFALAALDEALQIGPTAPGFSRPVPVDAAAQLQMAG